MTSPNLPPPFKHKIVVDKAIEMILQPSLISLKAYKEVKELQNRVRLQCQNYSRKGKYNNAN